jgi:hypothetical protein
MSEPALSISFRIDRLVQVLFGCLVFFVLAHIATQTARFTTGHSSIFGLVELFNLDRENNIPTAFGSFILIIAALFAALIGQHARRQKEKYATHWLLMAALFSLFALDEAASMHEWLEGPVKAILGTDTQGFFFYAWVIPGIMIVLALALIFFRFFLQLPRMTQRGLLVAFLLYFGGAIGVEILEGRYEEVAGEHTPGYAIFTLVEETLEMLGVLVAIRTLANDFVKRCDNIHIAVRDGANAEAPRLTP